MLKKKIIISVFCALIFSSVAAAGADAAELRTLEYFVGNYSAQTLSKNAFLDMNFSFQLTDTGADLKNTYFDIYASYDPAGTDTNNILLNGTQLQAYNGATSGEAYMAHYLVNASSAFYTQTEANKNAWGLAYKTGATSNGVSGLTAKLVATYEYTSPPKTKTVRFYINNTGESVAASAWRNTTFPISLPGTNVAVKSTFFEVTQVTIGTADTTPEVWLNNTFMGKATIAGTAPSYGFFFMANASSIYSIADSNDRNYNLALKCGAGNTCEGLGAVLVVTYTSDDEAPIDTSRFFINTTRAQIAANGWQNTSFSITMSDPSPNVKSGYIVVRGIFPTVTPTVKVYLNDTLLTSTAYTATVETANFLLFANATNGNDGFFKITDNSQYDYDLAIQCTAACEVLSSEGIITYNYSTTVADATAPTFALNASNTTAPAPSAGVLLYANWSDNTDLQWAMLETNETGAAKNKTASPTAPIQINLTGTNSWSNFSWINSSVAGGTEIAWRIFGNDSAGNTNVTGLATFRIFQQINQPVEQSLSVNFQNQNAQNLFSVIRNAITATLQVDRVSTFFKTTNNVMTTNTAFVSLSTFLRSISQAVTQNAAYTTVSNFLRTISKIVAASFATQSIGAFFKTITNAITTNTVVGPISSLFKIISQAFAQNSAITTARGTLVSVSQAITQNAVTQTAYSLMRTISQAITPNNITKQVGSFLRPISQAITQNSATQTIQSIFKTISQAITQNAATKSVVSMLRSISQAITQNVYSSNFSSIFKTISQAVTQNSATQLFSTFLKSVSQAVETNSAVTTIKGVLATVSQAITQSSAFKSTVSIFRTLSQTITQNIVMQSISSIFKIISQAITSIFRSGSQAGTQDYVVKSVTSIFKTISQAVTQNSAAQAVQSIFKTISQAVTQNSAFKSVVSIFRTISNAISANTATQIFSSIFKNISQVISQASSTKNIASVLKSVSQAITQNSVFKSTVGIFKTISQAVTQNSAEQTIQSIFKIISQAVTQNSATQTFFSFFRSLQQSVSANIITQPINSFFRAISNSIAQSSVAKSISSIFKNISEFLTANTANKIASNFLRSVSQYFQPEAFGFGGAYHRFFISVSQAITYHYNTVFGYFRPPEAPSGPTVAVVYGGGPGLGETGISPARYPELHPTIQPTVVLKPPVSTSSLQFLKVPALREARAGDSILDGIIVKNSGSAEIEEVETSVSGISPKWITILPSSTDISVGERQVFAMFMNIPKDASTGDYLVSVRFKTSNINEMASFMLRVKGIAIAENITAVVGNITSAIGNATLGTVPQLPIEEKAVTASRAISVDTENQKTEIVLNVKNGPEPQYNVLVTEKIKKEIANSTDLLEFSGPVEIIEKDPIVRWKINELAPFETKNFTYTVKQVLPDYSALVYWPTEEVALSPSAVEGIRVESLKPIEIVGGRITPVPVIIENIGNKARNISIVMKLPEGWSLIPQTYNYTLAVNETKLFDFNLLLPTDVYPGYYVGKVFIAVDGQTVIKEYEFAVLNNLELLVRPLVIVVSIFFGIGVLWIRIKIIELNTEIDEIKRLTEIHASKEEIEARMEKARRGLRDLEALRRDNVIDNYTYNIEKEELSKTLSSLNKAMERAKKEAREEMPERGKKVKKAYGRLGKLQEEQEYLEKDYSEGHVNKNDYKVRKAMLDREAKGIQKVVVGSRTILEKIKSLMQSRKALVSGISKLKLAYEEGIITKYSYESGSHELKEKLKRIDGMIRKESGVVEKTKKQMIGSDVLLKFFSKVAG